MSADGPLPGEVIHPLVEVRESEQPGAGRGVRRAVPKSPKKRKLKFSKGGDLQRTSGRRNCREPRVSNRASNNRLAAENH